MMRHAVMTFDLDKEKCLYESRHQTAESAYEEYKDIIGNLRRNLPIGEKVTVARYNDGDLMTCETVEGGKAV